jgi:TonB-linked SusC/RagA family outer membrane protein
MKGKYFDTSMSVEKIFANMGLNSGATGAASISSKLSTETKLASFFGRFNYRFDERYLFTFTMRADGSSKFAKGNRWGYFPAAVFAWRMSEENFMENTKEWLSNLKLRLSYGTAGNNRIGNTMYKLDYKSYTGSKFYGVGDTQNPYYVATNSLLPNPDLKWETTVTRNLGIDFGFWNERLTGTFDVYWNSTKDLLIQSAIVAPGYTLKQENVGETSNKGIELSLNGLILKHKDYSLSANFNIGFNKNRVESLADGITEQSYNSGVFGTDIQSTYEYLVRVGQPIGLIYGYVTDGYYTTDDFTGYDATTNTYTLKDGVPTNGLIQWVRPGSLKLKDLDGDGKITASNDRKIIGKTAPKFTGGFGLNATWKGFDLSAMFNFVYGNKIYNADKIVTSQTYTATTNFSNLQSYMNSSNRYTYLDANGQIVTDLATLKAMNEGANAKQYWAPASLGDRTPILHSWAIEDGSFIRLQNLTLGYTIPKNLTQKFACNQLRVYCTLNNVFCLTDYSGYDPEVNSPARSSSSSGVMPGIDFSSYPKSFSWTAGVNLTF